MRTDPFICRVLDLAAGVASLGPRCGGDNCHAHEWSHLCNCYPQISFKGGLRDGEEGCCNEGAGGRLREGPDRLRCHGSIFGPGQERAAVC